MSQAIYRKYRPQSFSEIIGQKHIIQTLSNAIQNDRIGHAYIFTGPRGTGKTTLARVFAKSINCQNKQKSDPCNQCENCQNITQGKSLDIIEIDAASNTGVDNIRELRETIKLPPSKLKYKTYIIDEVHMLSTGAFNALLKTLEEPPAHAVFILATTEIHKIPETILSRCQRFDFGRISTENIVSKLSQIAISEKIKFDKESLEMIAIASEGGLRDAESLFSQIISFENKNITGQIVRNMIGATNHEELEEIVDLITQKDASSVLKKINELSQKGFDLEIFSKSLVNYLRQLMVISVSDDLAENFSFELTSQQIEKLKQQTQNISTYEIIKLLENISPVPRLTKEAFLPQLPLELAIIKSITPSGTLPTQSTPIQHKTVNIDIENNTGNKPPQPDQDKLESTIDETTESIVIQEKPQKEIDFNINDIKKKWGEIIYESKTHNHSLSALLSNCDPVKIDKNVVIIGTKYGFYKDKLNETANRLTIEDVLVKIMGSPVKITFSTEQELGVKINPKTIAFSENKDSANNNLLNDAMNIFGGKMVE